MSGGTITSDGGGRITARGVCWGTSEKPTILDEKTTDGVGTDEFTSKMVRLQSSTNYYVRAYAQNSSGTGYGNTLPFTSREDFSDPLTDIDGNVYKTVKIGDQWWMAENLRVTRYSNGDSIPYAAAVIDWICSSTGARCAYDNDESNVSKYGYLYNWYAVVNSSGIAPDGWHVPSEDDFLKLENYLISRGYNWDNSISGNKIGKSLASKTGWNNSNEVGDVGNDMITNNASGFSALPGGEREDYFGLFGRVGRNGYWWSTTEYSLPHDAWRHNINYDHEYLGRTWASKNCGFSVRLVRD